VNRILNYKSEPKHGCIVKIREGKKTTAHDGLVFFI